MYIRGRIQGRDKRRERRRLRDGSPAKIQWFLSGAACTSWAVCWTQGVRHYDFVSNREAQDRQVISTLPSPRGRRMDWPQVGHLK